MVILPSPFWHHRKKKYESKTWQNVVFALITTGVMEKNNLQNTQEARRISTMQVTLANKQQEQIQP